MTPSKNTQQLTREELKHVLSVARGDGEIDILIKNVKIMDLVNGEINESAIAIAGKSIAGTGLEYLDQKAKRTIDAKGAVAVPGFIDGHLHVESSMMHPFEFERLTLPLGTTTAICDPHEITNVMGDKGFSWFLRCSELMKQNLFVQVSSCVPALPGFETNGGPFPIEKMKKYKDHPNVLGLAEMMNFPGVINAFDEVLDKIEEFQDMNLDGHCPLVQGKQLNAYIAAGIQNCHETITQEEGKEKLSKGMALIIREGSVAKNLKTLAPLVNDFNSIQCLLCTDDRNPYEIFNEGHINYLVKKMIKELNIAPHIAYRLSSYSAAKHFNLKRLGLIAPGKQADIVLLSDYQEVEIQQVLMKGVPVAELNLPEKVQEKLKESNPPIENTMKREALMDGDISFSFEKGIYNVIEIVKDEIITNHLKIEFDGEKFLEDDIRKIVVIERYGHGVKPALGLVKGSGLKNGAIASSVAHDSHNIIVIGEDEKEMTVAVNKLLAMGGGFCVVDEGKVVASLELPIAGLISLENAEVITEGIVALKAACSDIGVHLNEPFIQMAFLALPVIPSLKITDKGLVDVTKFEFIDLKD
ncbi:adenine deaminase [Halobacteriovorax marinus]|uniref:Adenine deaminase n=1 Tax=Halobacteriovorax marinus TaxID=97084 RepID=A0A1Y5FCK4_9BACT|nr:adenine deaminase [Halobacteriovorax marinus]